MRMQIVLIVLHSSWFPDTYLALEKKQTNLYPLSSSQLNSWSRWYRHRNGMFLSTQLRWGCVHICVTSVLIPQSYRALRSQGPHWQKDFGEVFALGGILIIWRRILVSWLGEATGLVYSKNKKIVACCQWGIYTYRHTYRRGYMADTHTATRSSPQMCYRTTDCISSSMPN